MNSIAGRIPPTSNLRALQPDSNISTSSNPKYTITDGQFGGINPTINGVAIGADSTINIITFLPTDQVVYIQCDFTYIGSTKTIVDAKIITATSVAFLALTPVNVGSGTGIINYKLWDVIITAPTGSGIYSILTSSTINGSLNFDVCLGLIADGVTGPYDA